MKRILAMLAAGLIAAGGAAAQEQKADGAAAPAPDAAPAARTPRVSPLSLGGGVLYGADLSTWQVDKTVPGDLRRYDSSITRSALFGFFDAKYAELTLGFLVGQAQNSSVGSPYPADLLGVLAGAAVKLPFALSPVFTLYPLAGAEYSLYLDTEGGAKFAVAVDKEAGAREALSSLSFRGGLGLDTYFNESLFLRVEALYGAGFPNKVDDYLAGTRPDTEWRLSHGGAVKCALGFRPLGRP